MLQALTRSAQPGPRCPWCASPNVAVAVRTRAAVYVACRSCDHVWQTDAVRATDRWTSAAFRISRRILGLTTGN